MTASRHQMAPREESRQRVLEKIWREAGPVVAQGLSDPSVVEILLNPDGHIWFDRLGTGMEDTGSEMSPSMATAFLGTVAAALDAVITKDAPVLEGELPLDGSRIEGVIPPVVASPVFAIRKRISKIVSLEDYVREGRMRVEERRIVEECVFERRNILVVGGTGSGKTTFGNAILRAVADACPCDRAVILEDTVELQCPLANKTMLRTTPSVSMRHLLRATMRLRPDRIIVGEVRGGEALDLLKAWNTGHPGGLATVHADDALAGLVRLEELVAEAASGHNPALIARAVHLLVHLVRLPEVGPVVHEIVRVDGYRDGYLTTTLSRREVLRRR